ncbi:MPZL2 protein, partial [Polyodon spathula]|nr:MPZL2 protein [Polyodon spathula]
VDVCAVEVYTPVELQAVNGTDARLKCTFTSSAPISVQASVSWNFRPLSGGIEESVFYYQEQPYTPTSGKFKGRAVWSGDIRRGDASITIRDLKFSDNGTYSCHVKNPPEDVHGQAGELQLRVVSTGGFLRALSSSAGAPDRSTRPVSLTRALQSRLGQLSQALLHSRADHI